MDDLQEFLAHQKALADMPEGDIDDYEARLRLRAKRRKLWKSDDEQVADLSERERETSELPAYLQSLVSSDDDTHKQRSRSIKRPLHDHGYSSNRNDAFPAATEKKQLHQNTRDPSHDSKRLRDDSAKVMAHDCSNKGLSGSSDNDRMTSSPSAPPEDIQFAYADAEYDNGGQFLSDQGDSNPSEIPSMQQTKISKNGVMNLRERVLKKRKVSGSDGPAVADTSNVTSPPNSPSISSSPPQVSRTLRPRPTVDTIRKEKRAKKAERDKETAERKKREELEKKMTPTEYAAHVQSKFTEYLAKASAEKLPLRDKAIFYVGGDYYTASQRTRKKMDHLRKKGAALVPSYDPEVVTHIITEGNAAVTLKALRLKSLDEIPMYIPTVTWSWVTEGNPESPEFWFAAFPSRIDASSEKAPDYLKAWRLGKTTPVPRPMEPTDEDYSRIEDFTMAQDTNSNEPAFTTASKVSNTASSSDKASTSDPLAEFYDQARKEAESDLLYSGNRTFEDEDRISGAEEQKSKWTCDNKPVKGAQCVNQDIVNKLSELEEINKTKLSGDPREQRWRVFSYGKSIRAIRTHSTRIRNYEDAIAIRGVGKKTADKIVEIIKTGDLERIRHDKTEDVQAIKLFNNIYGVGLGTSQKWYAMGCRTLEDVKNRKGGIKLSGVQDIGLRYYDDINARIPRSEVEEIFNMIKSIALGIDPKLFFPLMGSYRRGAETCGDIDILMSRPTDDGKTHKGVLRLLLKELHKQGILTEDLAIPEDFNDLEQTYRGLCRRYESSPRRRIDILAVPYHERGGALIYYTGDDIFNRAIRLKAKSMGYSLSQHGLSKRVLRDERGKKMVPADLIASETEEEIFRVLGVPWQEPHERIRAL